MIHEWILSLAKWEHKRTAKVNEATEKEKEEEQKIRNKKSKLWIKTPFDCNANKNASKTCTYNVISQKYLTVDGRPSTLSRLISIYNIVMVNG